MAAVVLPSATDTDALSTALLTLGPEGLDTLARGRGEMRALVVAGAGRTEGLRATSRGMDLLGDATPPPAPPGGP